MPTKRKTAMKRVIQGFNVLNDIAQWNMNMEKKVYFHAECRLPGNALDIFSSPNKILGLTQGDLEEVWNIGEQASVVGWKVYGWYIPETLFGFGDSKKYELIQVHDKSFLQPSCWSNS